MATETQILDILETLRTAYPAFHPRDAKKFLDLYTEKLAAFPVEALRKASDRIIELNKFFPSISEISAAARPFVRIEGDASWYLERLYEIEGLFTRERIIDRDGLALLVKSLGAVGKVDMRQHVEEKARRFDHILAAEQGA